jgi:hypothetical protein
MALRALVKELLQAVAQSESKSPDDRSISLLIVKKGYLVKRRNSISSVEDVEAVCTYFGNESWSKTGSHWIVVFNALTHLVLYPG